ncbi:MAG: hypothetical protein EBZ61_11400, partial [Micrococcales bacterium]|nr:hypothetical protein [Micrococcales bacterium]
VIVALATPPGTSALAVIRVSGEGAIAVVSKIWQGKSLAAFPANSFTYGKLVDEVGIIDEVVASIYHHPKSYTGQEMVEIATHGNMYVAERAIRALIAAGGRQAEPGEFTKRAFLNGKLEGTTPGSASADSSNNWVVGKILAASQGGYFNGYISNLRVTKSVALYTSEYTPSTTPLSSTVAGGTVSLLTCQSNRFIDSTNNFTITTSGSPSVQAFSPFNPTSSWSAATNGGSGYFDGSGDYLTVASNAALQLNGEFTVEVWFYPLSLQTYESSNALGIFLKSNGGVQVYNQVINAVIFDTSSGVILNAWNHIAVTRNSSNGVDFWLNGVSQGATQTVSSNFASTTPTAIGNSSSLTQEFHGYIASTRIVKGIAVYTAAFTPPTAPLTATQSANTNGNPSAAITGTATSLLLNFTNAGIYDATSKNDLETVG